MWRVIVQCSAEGWRIYAKDFKAIAAQYGAVSLSSRKMKDDERRIMEFQLETVDDAEEFQEQCNALEGFTALFEAL
jgi:hypothetical protein